MCLPCVPGLKHVRGILLYGPPGTGKTLTARQIGKMLNAREPKIVNGPSILDKYVGESEANIRKLFADAEEEFKRMGNQSALHIIIFDEIDAICKARGSLVTALTTLIFIFIFVCFSREVPPSRIPSSTSCYPRWTEWNS